MSSLIEIQSQIEKLQKQALEIRSREFDKTVKEIRAKMLAFGITTKDLQVGAGRGASKKKVATKSDGSGVTTKRTAKAKERKGVAVAPKYLGPNGETWSGRGLTPRWLAELIAHGESKESFAIKR